MKLQLDSRGYYSSRLGVNMHPLGTGEYTFLYKLYYLSSINSSEVKISVVSSIETVGKVTTNVFSDHT